MTNVWLVRQSWLVWFILILQFWLVWQFWRLTVLTRFTVLSFYSFDNFDSFDSLDSLKLVRLFRLVLQFWFIWFVWKFWSFTFFDHMQYILLRFIDWIFQSCFLQFYRLFSWNFGHKWWCAKPPLVFMGWTSWPCLVRTDDAIQSAKNMFLEVYPLLQKNILTLSCDWISKKNMFIEEGEHCTLMMFKL